MLRTTEAERRPPHRRDELLAPPLRSFLSSRFPTVRRLAERALLIGTKGGLPVDLHKRIRLSNLLAFCGIAIMSPWAAGEALCGDAANVPLEAGFLACFVAVLALDAARLHRLARLLLVVTANGCVFAGALIFERGSGGTLPFFGLVALPMLLFGPQETVMVALGVSLPMSLFAAVQTGSAANWLAVQPRAAPPWYFAANVASAFAVAFVIPFFFYRSNLKAEALLEQAGREKLRRVIDSNLIGVVRGRLSGQIEEANDTFLNLLGYNRQDLATGALDLKAIAPLEPPEPGGGRVLSELPRRGVSRVYERSCLGKDGAAVPTLVGVALLDDSHDEVVGFVLDLSAQKRVEVQKAMLRESEEAIRLRDLFNSIASHELKTPLTALILNLRMLHRWIEREAPTSSTLRVHAERCESCAARLGELIHTLLDVAQIPDGKLKLTVREMDVVEAVRKIGNGFEVGAPPGGAPQILVHEEGPVIARLDSLRFDQVVINLLSNAIKYGAGNPVEVRVGRDCVADAVRLEVIDGGPGIEPQMVEKIFEPFQRAVSPDAVIPGLGLGLYVVKMIVEGHGGTINVESRPGHGSRFIVTLPCTAAPHS